MSQYGWKNCPDSTRGPVSRLVSALRSRLDRSLVGVYLHGSLAMGCFNPAASDVDLLAVTKGDPIIDAQKAIVEELLKLSKAPTPIEFTLLRTSDLAPWRYPTPYLLQYGEDHREQLQHELEDGAWRHWNDAPKLDYHLAHMITDIHPRGICLYGEPIETVFPVVPREDYLASILADPDWSKQHLEQRPASAVLNLCRTLAYVREGKILSKDEGGRWAMDKLPNPLLLPVRSAMQVYSGLYSEMYATPEQVKAFSDRISGEIEKALHPG